MLCKKKIKVYNFDIFLLLFIEQLITKCHFFPVKKCLFFPFNQQKPQWFWDVSSHSESLGKKLQVLHKEKNPILLCAQTIKVIVDLSNCFYRLSTRSPIFYHLLIKKKQMVVSNYLGTYSLKE